MTAEQAAQTPGSEPARESRSLWARLWNRVLQPTLPPEDVEAVVRRARAQLPAPVFWLLGKTQSGKTSIIRALTGNSRLEIGTGIRPCTRTAREYAFPSEHDCILRFLDTRGLGEVEYDPAEDMAAFEAQAHLLIVVMKALDHAQHAVLQAVSRIHRARPEWPVLVVQTSLHEGYPSPHTSHLVPYPYDQSPLPPQVPSDLVRSLLSQRQMFEQNGIRARFVAVDFTQAEDGYEPVNYGLDALWTEIDLAFPLGLRGMLQRTEEFFTGVRDLQYRSAHPQIIAYSLAAGAAAGIPVPWVDIPLVFAVQGKMLHALASIYGQDVDGRRLRELLGALGVGQTLHLGAIGGRELLKVVPGLGSAIAAVYSAACTYALGRTACLYLAQARDGILPDREEYRQFYEQQLAEGQQKLRAYLDQLRSGSAPPHKEPA